ITLTEAASTLLQPGLHGTTFGGNPVAAAVALATIHVIERDDLLRQVASTGEHMRTASATIGHPLVAGVRGLGLLLAVSLTEAATTLLQPGQHCTTFGGNPVSAAAALATIHVIERDDLLRQVASTGEHLRTAIATTGHPLVAGVRGEGLLIAVELAEPVAAA